MKKITKLLFVTLFILVIVYAKMYGVFDYLTLDFLKSNRDLLATTYLENNFIFTCIFFFTYIIVTALSLPGAAILTLAGGAIFGLYKGLLVVSFASSIGASLAFLISKLFLRNYVQLKFKKQMKSINEGFKKDGLFYLFTLRLIPAVPFFVINLVMGLMPISLIKFYLISQVGMLAGTAVYVNAGVELSKISNLSSILSPSLILSFVVLGVFPILAKKVITYFSSLKVYKKFTRPKKYEYNMVVIGAGSAGLVTSYICSAVKAKVALIEKHKMGGDCLNTGCVPSKALIKSAKVANYFKNAKKYGIESQQAKFDFSNIMGRVHNVIAEIEPHDSIDRYSKLGVECITGSAKIISPWEVEVNGKILTTRNITIATGARPFVPPIPGLDLVDAKTSDNLWQITQLPKRFVILGGGPIGCEMAQSFARLGSIVYQVEMKNRIMSIEDEDVSEEIEKRFIAEGINVLTNHTAKEFKIVNGEKILVAEVNGDAVEIAFDEVLVAVGRSANIHGFGVEELGIELRENKTIKANDYLQTNFPNIYVCGDVTGPFQLTHTASHQAWYCAVNALFGRFKKFKVDYSVIPWATYTDPEVATVGLNETTAKRNEIEYEVTKYGIDDLDRAIADSENYGFVKVLTVPGKDKILGATIVGNHASDLLLEFIQAMKYNIGLNKILGTIHIYPTMGEANKYLAGNWKRKQVSTKVLEYLSKFHSFMR